MTQTFKTFLGKNTIGNPLSDTLKTMTPSVSTFILYIGIDKPFKGLPLPGTKYVVSPCLRFGGNSSSKRKRQFQQNRRLYAESVA